MEIRNLFCYWHERERERERGTHTERRTYEVEIIRELAQKTSVRVHEGRVCRGSGKIRKKERETENVREKERERAGTHERECVCV